MQVVAPIEGLGWPTRAGLRFGFHRPDNHVHQGVDVVAPIGTPVRATAAGRVVKVITGYTPGWRGYGRCILIRHELGGGRAVWTFYAHLDSADVAEGDDVDAGERIGTVGVTKWTTRALETFNRSRAHLHYEVRTRQPVRPEPPAGAIIDRIDPVVWHASEGAPLPFPIAVPATMKACPTCRGTMP